jgi:hypothetical protein
VEDFGLGLAGALGVGAADAYFNLVEKEETSSQSVVQSYVNRLILGH